MLDAARSDAEQPSVVDGGQSDAGCSPTTPGTPETHCNAIDDDCDAVVDEGFADEMMNPVVIGVACDGPDQGSCGADGTTDTNPGAWSCVLSATGAATCNEPLMDDVEVCDALAADEDCDGMIDEFQLVDDGPVVHLGDACVQGGATASEAPACAGTYVCASTSTLECVANTVPPTEETCNGLDDDCDGSIDEEAVISGAAVDAACAAVGKPCGTTAAACSGGEVTCTAGNPNTTYYRDEDGDGYGGNTSMTACSAGDGWETDSDDCCDSDGRAHPGAHGEPSQRHGCGGFDFNCDGRETKLIVNSETPPGQCYRSACDGGFRRGWDGFVCQYGCNVPCGRSCAYVDGDAYACTASHTKNEQQWCN